ncbi:MULTISPECIES: helix-turn-helix transcriptional regulator [Kitasatospora]|uniref:Putative ArsR family transcriptional regulator n=1 Tax=Kitasatospora setae (strain ATCC 33774 / DSM 43861 / JCM 3304 / KCC A-0304 / NBRC 14216 / KM-6054) TaxID=452652 RepID=E4N877_KITSK|nr:MULTISPECIES: helix-turn-helix transcriptional regulator [Kitasatospora]BAJ27408.1 putative ArsR family transcriptional regulator [Kitasatospora setae KM-6054]
MAHDVPRDTPLDHDPNCPGLLPEPPASELHLVAVLHALADPMRLRIVADLAGSGGSELNCLAFDLPVTKSTMTHHFRVLREAGLIRQHRRGTSKMNALRADDLAARFPGLLESVLAAVPSCAALSPAATTTAAER